MFTIDASVHINALNPVEEGSPDSEALLERIFGRPWPVFSPTLLLVEVAAALTRILDDPQQGIKMAEAIHGLPAQIWVALDESLAHEAARLGAEHRLRGADAVYAAVARRYSTKLVTCDRQQLERLSSAIPLLTPAQALARFAEATGTDQDAD